MSKLLTATTWAPAPTANSVSVTGGISEMMRFGAAAGATTAFGCAAACSGGRAVDPLPAADQKNCNDRCERSHDLLTSSHRKNGPPMSAVITPTGSSTGDSAVRAITSHPMRKAAPNSAEAGSTTR